jgi:hypothetical protein
MQVSAPAKKCVACNGDGFIAGILCESCNGSGSTVDPRDTVSAQRPTSLITKLFVIALFGLLFYLIWRIRQ